MNMTKATQGVAIFLGLICILVGLIDLAEQYKLGEDLQWRAPIIIIGLGVGLPIIFIPISKSFESSDSSDSESDSSDFDDGDGSGD